MTKNLTSPEPISPTEHQTPEITSPAVTVSSAPTLPEDPAWKLIDVVIMAGIGFLALVFSDTATLVIAHYLPRFHHISLKDLEQNAFVLVCAQTTAYLLLLSFMVYVVRVRSRGEITLWDRLLVPSLQEKSVTPKRSTDFLTAISWNAPKGKAVLLAVGLGIGLAYVSLIFTGILSRWVPKHLPVDKYFRDASSTYLLAAFGVIVAPFIEELFFRGFMYPALERHIGVGSSMVLTAAAFAVVHQQQLAHAWVPLAWLFLFGIVQAFVRIKTRSVAACVLIHTAYNATHFVLFFVATDGFRHLERAT